MSQSAFVKSTLILTVATLISKVLGSIFRIPLQNIAGDEVLGIFSLVYPVYMVALILSVAGIPIAISKLIAEARARNEQQSIKEIYITASILALLFGITGFLLIYSLSSPLAAALGGPATRLALIVVAATLLVAPYMAVYRGFFQGFGEMGPTAISQVIEQFIRVSLILSVAYFLVMKDYSNEIVAGGLMSGSVAGAFISLVYLRIKYNHSHLKLGSVKNYSSSIFFSWSKKILNVSIPIAIGTITMALMNFVDSFTIPYGLKASEAAADGINYLYGIYGRGLSLVQIATVFATSVVLPLIPLITTNLAKKDYIHTRTIIEKSYRITHIISWPAAIGLFSLTLPLNLALFTNFEGSWVLAIIGFSSVFTSFTILGTGILQGMNFAKAAAIIILAGVVIKTFSNIYLINLFGLNGAALSTLVVYIILFAVNTFYLFRKLRFTALNLETFKVILASVTMGAIIGIPALFMAMESWTRLQASLYLAAAVLSGITVYLLQLLLLKVIDKKDLKRLPLAGKFIK